jgi:hypothetical protein
MQEPTYLTLGSLTEHQERLRRLLPGLLRSLPDYRLLPFTSR